MSRIGKKTRTSWTSTDSPQFETGTAYKLQGVCYEYDTETRQLAQSLKTGLHVSFEKTRSWARHGTQHTHQNETLSVPQNTASHINQHKVANLSTNKRVHIRNKTRSRRNKTRPLRNKVDNLLWGHTQHAARAIAVLRAACKHDFRQKQIHFMADVFSFLI